jgi:phage gp36-like protein
MPRFLTRQELIDRRGQDELLRLAGGVEATLDEAVLQAEALAVSYLLVRYRQTLPTEPATTPEVLKAAVAVFAHRKLVTAGQPSPALDQEAAQSLAWLRDVARGAAALDLPDAPPQDDTTPAILSNAKAAEPPGLRLCDLEPW